MKKVPKDPNWHYLKWLGIAIVSVLLFGIVTNLDKSLEILGIVMNVLSPIFIGIFIAFILNIPVNFFEYKVFRKLTLKNGRIWSKIKRGVSVILSITTIFLVLTLLLSYIIPECLRTCQGFIEKAPQYMEDLNSTVKEFIVSFNLPIDPESVTISWDTALSWLQSFMGSTSSEDVVHTALTTAITIFSSFWNVILGFIIAVYILASKESLTKLARGFLFSACKEEKAKNIISVFHLSKKAFEGFVAGQCMEVMLIGVLTFIGMLIFQFPYPLMVACIIALTAFVPIFGAIIGAIISAFLILLVDPIQAICFLIFIIVLQQLESNIIYPKMMGQQVGLPSLWVLISVIIGGELFGIPGIIISVPLCSVLYTLFHEWILKKLREKRLCKADASQIPDSPSPLSEEEFLTPEVNENKDDNKKDSESTVKTTQKAVQGKNSKKKKTKKSKK